MMLSKQRCSVAVASIPKATDEALLLGMDHGEDFWVPKSLVAIEEKPDGRYRVTLPIWFVENKQEEKDLCLYYA